MHIPAFCTAFFVTLLLATPYVRAACIAPAGQGGDIIYNSDYAILQYCNDSGWVSFPKTDVIPDAFTFTALTNQTTATLVTSNIVTMNGLDAPASVTLSGDGTPQFRINGGAWTTIGSVNDGDTLQLRMTTGAAGTMNVATVKVGWGDNVEWNVSTTGADTTPNAFAFTDITNATVNTVTESNTITISGINSAATVSISGAGTPQFRINGGAWGTSGSITNNQTLQIRLTSAATSPVLRSATVTVGTLSDQWDVTTAANLSGMAVVTNLGLTSNLKMMLDAGVATSASTANTKWLDLSGNGTDFFLGSSNSAEGSDPTFNGTPGGLSANEYWSSDGGDYFSYDSATETWMNNLHKNNARFTICQWIQHGSTGVYRGIFNTRNGWSFSSGNGIEFNAMSSGDGNRYYLRVTSTSEYFSAVLNFESTLTADAGTWQFTCVSINEATGSNGLIIYKNGTAQTASSTYNNPSSGSAQFAPRSGLTDQYFPNGTKIGMFMAWEGTNLTTTQMNDIFNATRGRYGL